MVNELFRSVEIPDPQERRETVLSVREMELEDVGHWTDDQMAQTPDSLLRHLVVTRDVEFDFAVQALLTGDWFSRVGEAWDPRRVRATAWRWIYRYMRQVPPEQQHVSSIKGWKAIIDTSHIPDYVLERPSLFRFETEAFSRQERRDPTFQRRRDPEEEEQEEEDVEALVEELQQELEEELEEEGEAS